MFIIFIIINHIQLDPINCYANVLLAEAKTEEKAPPDEPLVSYLSKLIASVSLMVALAIITDGSIVIIILFYIIYFLPLITNLINYYYHLIEVL